MTPIHMPNSGATVPPASDDLVYGVDSASDEDADDTVDMWLDFTNSDDDVQGDDVQGDDVQGNDAQGDGAQAERPQESPPPPSLAFPSDATLAKFPKAWGCGPKTSQRARQRKERTMATATSLGLRSIDTFFAPVSDAPSGTPVDAPHVPPLPRPALTVHKFNSVALAVAFEAISSQLSTLPNQSKSTATFKLCSLYDVQRLNAVCVYFRAILDGMGRMEASRIGAMVLGRSTFSTSGCSQILY
jgi:hypothetical protein